MENKVFKFCVVGNIVRAPHLDKNGILRYGTPAYTGGTKVYLCGKLWRIAEKEIQVVGLTRGKKYQVHDVPVNLIENVRAGKAFDPGILAIMNNFEFWDWWWNGTRKDQKATKEFVSVWDRKDELNSLTDCIEVMKVTSVCSASEYWWLLPNGTELTFDNKRDRFLDLEREIEYEIVEKVTENRAMLRLKSVSYS